ncbi:MAG TPA: hypothetical protein VN516_07140, partial [Candidatus Baltobacteraceae bacterium]|nr:hypothetical protein [Candidatus Baltobacteraceae bacterium]
MIFNPSGTYIRMTIHPSGFHCMGYVATLAEGDAISQRICAKKNRTFPTQIINKPPAKFYNLSAVSAACALALNSPGVIPIFFLKIRL